MTNSEEKLSFSLSSKPKLSSSASSRPYHNFHKEEEEEEEEDEHEFHSQPQYITEFDPYKTLTPKPKTVIPPKPNTWNPHNQTGRFNPSLQSDNIHIRLGPEDPSSASDSQTHVSYGLNLRNKDNPPSAPASVEDISLRRLREDLNNLPEDRGLDEFKELPVESFGSALLAGYGWFEGRGIGLNAKEDVKVPQYRRRMGTEGLGFVRELNDVDQKPKRGIGYSSNDQVVAQKGVFVGKVVRVVDGKRVGLKGEVLEEPGSGSEASIVVLRLLESGEEVRVGLDQVAELGSVEEEHCLRKLRELEIKWEGNGRRYSSSCDYRETEG